MSDPEENPVANGLIALVAVAVVVGVLAGIGALLATRMLGLSGASTSSGGDPVAEGSMYLPDPVPTQKNSAPLVTLVPTPDETISPAQTSTPPATDGPTVTTTPTLDKRISLTAGTTAVANGEELLLTGTYATGEGAVLDISYKTADGSWEEFPLDVNVSGGIFQTYVATYRTGTIQWRVEDRSRNLVSNPITVRHG